MGKILEEILVYKRKEVKSKKENFPYFKLEAELLKAPSPRSFLTALSKSGMSLIAELKKASPSAGIIREDFRPVEFAKLYASAGASAISVLTDERFFQGDIIYLREVKENVELPVLRKDFIIDEYQILEARMWGADAVLLIAGILDEDKMKRFIELVRSLHMDSLVEVHTREELEKVLEVNPNIIGINNRDLTNFTVDLHRTAELIEYVPKEICKVSESGINTRSDVIFLEQLGVDAILVGESLMTAPNPAGKVRELLGERLD